MIRSSWLGWVAVVTALSFACAGSEEADTAGGSSGGSDGGGGKGGSDAGASDAKASDASKDTSGKDSGAGVGSPCTEGLQCGSGHCVDGVCCDDECSSECRSCKVPGKEGTCSLFAAGTDPETECGDPTAACSGKCDGSGACAYPGAEKLCGPSACKDGKQAGSACDGVGQCKAVETSCGLYQCFGSACLTTCSTDADCTTDAYCATNVCAAKKANGKSCSDAKECTSAICSQSVCCNMACASPSDCSTGTCLCNGTACATGDTCITWYIDVDKDGYGWGPKTALGCAATGPGDGQTWSKNKDDCYDTNSNAKPGQTAYFTTDRGDGSYDFDCDQVVKSQYLDITGLVCGDCGIKVDPACYSCGVLGNFNTYAFGCNSSNKCTITGEPKGYKKVVACGASDYLWSCDYCSTTSKADTTPTKQGCR